MMMMSTAHFTVVHALAHTQLKNHHGTKKMCVLQIQQTEMYVPVVVGDSTLTMYIWNKMSFSSLLVTNYNNFTVCLVFLLIEATTRCVLLLYNKYDISAPRVYASSCAQTNRINFKVRFHTEIFLLNSRAGRPHAFKEFRMSHSLFPKKERKYVYYKKRESFSYTYINNFLVPQQTQRRNDLNKNTMYLCVCSFFFKFFKMRLVWLHSEIELNHRAVDD